MIFYNHKQEFIGIDEEGLKLLNYNSLEDLLGVCSDVADLFAKEPGYIHNFKNFGWIDFLLHADSDATSAIVHANGRTFSCTLTVQKLFLAKDPSDHGYIIDMTHVKSLSGEEIKPHVIPPKAVQEPAPVLSTEALPPVEETVPSSLPDYGYLTPTPLNEPDTFDVPSFPEEETAHDLEPVEEHYADLILPAVAEEVAEVEVEEPILPEPTPVPAAPAPSISPAITRPAEEGIRYSQAEQAFIDTLKTDKGYRFDPSVAANELGLPVDLIEEFIGDFIQQSHDFKDELFEAALKGDINNLRILSHKLKGVAANLRIEDAFEALSIINTSSDTVEIEACLKYFYGVIAKLEGKEISMAVSETPAAGLTPEPTPKIEEKHDDIYEFMLKQDEDEPLLVQEEELYDFPVLTEESPFKEKTHFALDEPIDETIFETPEVDTRDDVQEDTEPEEVALVEEPEVKLHYDIAANAGALGIELPFFQELLGDYKGEASNAAERISAAISAFDTHTWKKIATDLKGISDNLRLSEISEQLAVLSQTNDAQEANKASKRLLGFIAQL